MNWQLKWKLKYPLHKVPRWSRRWVAVGKGRLTRTCVAYVSEKIVFLGMFGMWTHLNNNTEMTMMMMMMSRGGLVFRSRQTHLANNSVTEKTTSSPLHLHYYPVQEKMLPCLVVINLIEFGFMFYESHMCSQDGPPLFQVITNLSLSLSLWWDAKAKVTRQLPRCTDLPKTIRRHSFTKQNTLGAQLNETIRRGGEEVFSRIHGGGGDRDTSPFAGDYRLAANKMSDRSRVAVKLSLPERNPAKTILVPRNPIFKSAEV